MPVIWDLRFLIEHCMRIYFAYLDPASINLDELRGGRQRAPWWCRGRARCCTEFGSQR